MWPQSVLLDPSVVIEESPRRAWIALCCWIVVLTADSILLHWEPDASWLFMADAPLSRPLSSAHTWLLWDEVTTPVLARTPQTLWKQCCVASHRQSKLYQTRVPNLVHKNGHFRNHSLDFWNSLKKL